MKFSKGELVLKVGPKHSKNNGMVGVVDGYSRDGKCSYVRWRGFSDKTCQRYHNDYLSRIELYTGPIEEV